MTYNADGTAARKLLDALGLPADQNVIEWHRYVGTAPAATVAGEVTLIGIAGSTIALNFCSVVGSGQILSDGSNATYAHFTAGGSVESPVSLPTAPVPDDFTAEMWVKGTPNIDDFPAQLRLYKFGDGVYMDYSTGDAVWEDGWYKAPLSFVATPATAAIALNAGTLTAIVGCGVGDVYEAKVIIRAGGSSTSPSADGWVLDQDRTDALIEYLVTHGRPSPLESVGALSCSVQLARVLAGDVLPTAGERFRLTLNEGVASALGVADDERPRFTGEVTDVEVNAEDVLSVVQVTGVGRRARLGRVPVIASRPAELDGKRVRRALYKARIRLPLDVGTIDPGTRVLLPAEYTGGDSAQGIIDTATASTLGQLVEHRSGRLDWHDAEHRRGVVPAVTLTGADHIIKPFTWAQTVATVVNDVEVTYGPADARAVARVRDTTSTDPADGLGPYGAQLDTQLQDKADAYSLGSTIVGRYAWPAWMLPALTVDVVRTSLDRAAAVLSLSHGDKVTASGLPPDGAFTAGDLFVEGTTESFVRTAWRVSLAVADPTIAGVGVRWVDVDPLLTWNAVDPGIRWLDGAEIEESLGLGVVDVDGGDATASSPSAIFDGGDATAVHTTTLEGGAA